MSSTSSLRLDPATADQRLERLLRRASNGAGVEALLRRLGVGGEVRSLTRAQAARAELRPLVTRVARVGGTVAPAFLVDVAGEAGPQVVQQVARGLSQLADAGFLFVISPPRRRTLVFGCRAVSGLRFAPVARLHPRAADLQLLAELAAAPAGELARLLQWARVLDRGSVGVRFFRDIRAHRDALARAWTGLPARASAEREQLALLLLCRLLFLCFLQERGHLLGDRDFLGRLVRERHAAPLYDVVLRPLFFAVFNTRPEERSSEAARLGALPYLNGGLFEAHALERRYPGASLPDDVLLRTFADLLGRYRFSTADAADSEAEGLPGSGIDPEVLGRVFEALMAAPRRGETGSFYTPPAVVDGLVSRALAYVLLADGALAEADARRLVQGGAAAGSSGGGAAATRLRELRVLDPACGSGAFLLGALSRISRARAALAPEASLADLRQDVVARSLHGVDLLDDAALLCALRLWLALAPGPGEPVSPLPNLDRRVRQGDALMDPLDLLRPGSEAGPQRGAALAPEVRRLLCTLGPLGSAYLRAEPGEREALRSELHAVEAALARSWLDALRLRLERALREATAAREYRDLWGEENLAGVATRRAAERLEQRLREIDGLRRELEDARALPFFSFAVHFAAERSGFDLVLGNPPWVRAHRWPAALLGTVRERFRVCREAGWPGVRQLGAGGSGPGGQVDLALLFLERGVNLLAEGGTLAMLLPAKLIRSLFAGGARMLLLESTTLLELDDHSLDQHAVFAADAFTTELICQRSQGERAVRVTLRNRGREPLRFEQPTAELPLVRGDHRAPWLLVPPDVLAVLRAMQGAGGGIGQQPGLKLRRGVITGANDVLVIAAAEHRLAGLSRVRAQGWFRARRRGDARGALEFAAWIETESLRPLVRGADIKAWTWGAPQRVLWIPANERTGAVTPSRTARFLARHAASLRRRNGGGRTAEQGRLRRFGPELFGFKVAWQDIADDLHAVVLPARVRGDDGRQQPVVPLNTVYFIGTADVSEAHVLAALLNSLPLRVFARAAAERAKDARFRFFAWTVAALPLPAGWREGAVARELERISAAAHAAKVISPEAQQRLDALVAQAFRLSAAQLDALRAFDAWLKR